MIDFGFWFGSGWQSRPKTQIQYMYIFLVECLAIITFLYKYIAYLSLVIYSLVTISLRPMISIISVIAVISVPIIDASHRPICLSLLNY